MRQLPKYPGNESPAGQCPYMSIRRRSGCNVAIAVKWSDIDENGDKNNDS